MRRRVVFFAVFALLAGLLATPATAANSNGNAYGPRIDGVEGRGRSADAPGHNKGSAVEDKAPTKGKAAKPVNDSRQLQVNVLLSEDLTDAVLAELEALGRVRDALPEIRAVFMQIRAGDLDALRSLPFVASVGEDAERNAGPTDVWEAEDFSSGSAAGTSMPSTSPIGRTAMKTASPQLTSCHASPIVP